MPEMLRLTMQALRRFSLRCMLLIVLNMSLFLAGVSMTMAVMRRTPDTTSRPQGVLTLHAGSAVCLTAFACCYAITCATDHSLAWESRSWPTVKGTVIRCELDESGLEATYAYEVKGESFVGNTISFSRMVMDRPAERSRFARGEPVDVYYDPAYPTFSCLMPGFGIMSIRITLPMIVNVLLGAICGFLAFPVFG